MLSTVAVLALPPLSPFEFGAICEVFGLDRTEEGLPPIELRVCGPVAGEPVPMIVGAQVVPEYGLEGLQGVDLVAVAATRMREFPEPVIAAVREAADAGSIMLSACSGSFLLGAAGLLDDRPCTTHWMHATDLSSLYPRARVDPDVLFVDDGNVITSAGTGASIDACLHVVRRELGSAAVNVVARRMVVPPQRDGGQAQFVEAPVRPAEVATLAPVLDWVLAHLHEELSVSALARRAGMSERTFARRFHDETGTTPHRWLLAQRVALAERLLEEGDLPIEAVAHRCGFASAEMLRHHFRRLRSTAPRDFRRAFGHRSGVSSSPKPSRSTPGAGDQSSSGLRVKPRVV
jgi:transcriptional regulator GlxA family with amidase domain